MLQGSMRLRGDGPGGSRCKRMRWGASGELQGVLQSGAAHTSTAGKLTARAAADPTILISRRSAWLPAPRSQSHTGHGAAHTIELQHTHHRFAIKQVQRVAVGSKLPLDEVVLVLDEGSSDPRCVAAWVHIYTYTHCARGVDGPAAAAPPSSRHSAHITAALLDPPTGSAAVHTPKLAVSF